MSNQTQQEIESVELSIEQAKDLMKRRDAALKLSRNKEFKELILTGYFVDEAARLAHLSTDPTLVGKPQAEMVLNDLKGVGALKRYMSTIVMMGNHAEAEIGEHEATLDELREEGDE